MPLALITFFFFIFFRVITFLYQDFSSESKIFPICGVEIGTLYR